MKDFLNRMNDIQRVFDLERQGRYPEALKLLQRVRPDISEEEYRAEIKGLWARSGQMLEQMGWQIPEEEFRPTDNDAAQVPSEADERHDPHVPTAGIFEFERAMFSGKGAGDVIGTIDQMIDEAREAQDEGRLAELASFGLTVAYTAGVWEKARSYSELALQHTPLHFFLGFWSADTFRRRGDLEQARRYLQLCWQELRTWDPGPQQGRYEEMLRQLQARLDLAVSGRPGSDSAG